MTNIIAITNSLERAVGANSGSVQMSIPEDCAKVIIKALKKTTELEDTVEPMLSDDYKERFKAEYYQLKIRHEKLNKFNTIIAASFETRFSPNPIEEPKHDCPYKLLIKQQEIMEDYLHVLEIRAEIEGIDL